MTYRSKRLFLSPPHLAGDEIRFVHEAFESNYIAPFGPQVDAFEREFSAAVGAKHAAAVASGTAALHLALRIVGVGKASAVIAPSFTFIGGVSPAVFLGATLTFVDSERTSWNIDPALLEEELHVRERSGRPPAAVISADILGQCADMDPIIAVCARYGVPLVSDSAEALGALYKGRPAGQGARAAIWSFNGNKIITTSGGGMVTSDDEDLVARARVLAQQAREPAPHYEHTEVGYNYRLSNVLAAIGRGQLRELEDRVRRRREIFEGYRARLAQTPGLEFMPDAGYGRPTRWLTVVQIPPEVFGADREAVRLALEARNIESRPVWKPMHLQPVFNGCDVRGGAVSEDIFARGLCLPSGTAMTDGDLDRVAAIVQATSGRAERTA
jgi:dTDP-4-amino-4,6-dideoxygalactose transaminase